MSLIRSMRGGKDYDAEWGKRMKGTGPYAWQIARRFEIATKRLGLDRGGWKLDCTKFKVPARAGDQLALL
jgi:DNA repair photolyase